jgi:hypothetical protein
MNCSLVQRRLLATENPQWVPAELRAHLAYCSMCRDLQEQLLQVEAHISHLPVPRSHGKSRLLHNLLHPAVETRTPATIYDAPKQTVLQGDETARRHRPVTWVLRLGGAAALCLLLVWLILAGRSPAPSQPVFEESPLADPLLADLVARDGRLAFATQPRQRLEILADIADDLRAQTQDGALGAPGDELLALAELYKRVVREGILRQAHALPEAERRLVLGPIAARLAATANDVERQIREISPQYDRPLSTIVAVARAADRELRTLLET